MWKALSISGDSGGMSPLPVTPAEQIQMPRQQDLLLRGSRWSFNIKVPLDLQPALGKTHIREALGTSDYREACRKVAYERARVTALFENTRRSLTAAKRPQAKPEKTVLVTISKRDAYAMSVRYLASLEHECKKWMHEEGRFLEPHKLAEIASGIGWDAHYLASGEEFRGKPLDGTFELEAFLKAENIECAPSSPAFQTLRSLFFEAHLEYLARHQDVIEGRTIQERNPIFRSIHAHSQFEPEHLEITLGELLRRYEKMLVQTEVADVTRRTYKIPMRVLREVLGERTPLRAITKEKIRDLFDLLRRAPTNATKRFPGLKLTEAIAVADKRGEESRLSQKTLGNYFVNISAIFNFAVEEELMPANPAKGRILRAIVDGGEKRKRKAKFTDDELRRLFRAPLYTGCRDDENGFATPGANKPRRARFWLPLVGLFHGFRSNEAAQLYTEDIAEIGGIPVFKIRATRESGDESDKRLKTRQSERTVPIHPELIRIGFLEYVVERRRDTSESRLFPDNSCGADGYYSTPFGKWFARFKKTTLGKDCKATFHSFRHHFRDAMRDAEISVEYVEALGGWGNERCSEERRYGTGASLQRLREQLEKVKYPGLDLAHLFAKQPGAANTQG
jgi:hypothetical protein